VVVRTVLPLTVALVVQKPVCDGAAECARVGVIGCQRLFIPVRGGIFEKRLTTPVTG